MRPIHDHEIRHINSAPALAPPPRFTARDLLECLALPLAFMVIYLGWPLAFGEPSPLWAAVGVALYGALGVMASAWGMWKRASARR
jgi:hypothetical protein